MHKFTHLERRYSIFETPPFLLFFDKSERSSSTAILNQASISERASPTPRRYNGRGAWVVLHARWPDMRGGVRGGGERG
ncbi:hypothetical protein F383_11958 [Gossypium arboreum]|uniref:Uncharacterized protein n=1 Tax=Gossypium arboreum TaxID=29729 RepID=A0A0B0N9N3_GOSAR|nr:hypothetical protein F383_11958 [Gossypium arboreum]